MTNEKKAVKRFRLTDESVVKLEEMADRYGMTVNALISFIIGQWLDNNYDLKSYAREAMVKAWGEKLEKNYMELFSKPEFLLMAKDIGLLDDPSEES